MFTRHAVSSTTTALGYVRRISFSCLLRPPQPMRRSLSSVSTTGMTTPALLQECRTNRIHQQQQQQQQQYQQQFRRMMSRSSLDAPETAADKAVAFVVKVGYDPEIAKGVVDALKESGLSGEALLASVRSMAGRWEVGEDEGLESLAASVEQDLKARKNFKVVTVHVVPGNAWESGEEEDEVGYELYDEVPCIDDYPPATKRRSFVVKAYEGTTLTDVAKFGQLEGASTLGEYLECACSGIMACSTCHVVVDRKWFEKVGEPNEDEQDMLDLAYSPRRTSRLGCQITLTSEMDGIVLWLPKGHNNLMDHIPFEG